MLEECSQNKSFTAKEQRNAQGIEADCLNVLQKFFPSVIRDDVMLEGVEEVLGGEGKIMQLKYKIISAISDSPQWIRYQSSSVGSDQDKSTSGLHIKEFIQVIQSDQLSTFIRNGTEWEKGSFSTYVTKE